MTDGPGAFRIDFSGERSFDLEAIRRNRSAFMPDNGHAWVISTVFAIDDPEQALDSMALGAENFVGIAPIYCLMCSEKYRGVNRFYKCSQVWSSSEDESHGG